MNLNELSIGNYIDSICDECVYEVTKEFLKETIENNEFEDLIGIPITSEWLIKFGFETNNAKVGWYKYPNSPLTFRLQSNGLSIQRLDRGLWVIFIRLKYIHQLQNQWLLLTGNELTTSDFRTLKK